MELNNLTSKLKEIPFEKWKRETTPSSRVEYRTKIKGFSIKINISYPQGYIDSTKISLDILSPKNKIISDNLYNPDIGRIAMDLEETNNNLEKNERMKTQKENYKELSKLFRILKIA